MTKRRLGWTDLRISKLVLGANVFGWTADEQTSFAILDRFLDAGLETIDTADVYSAWAPGNRGGESETIIGEWMKRRGCRDRVVVITKVGSEMGPGMKGLSASYIAKAVEASLRRLQTDRIDLYFAHWPDPSTPHEETLGAFQKLIDAGKVRAIGASNYDADMLSEALRVAQAKKLTPFGVIQPEYNLYDRSSFEGALRDFVEDTDVGVITYFSLAKGFLSGKYRSMVDLGKSPRGGGVKKYLNERGFRILAALDGIAARHQAKPAEVALAWLMAQPQVTAPIASASTVEQVESLVRATTLTLAEDEVAALTAAGR